MKKLTLLSLTVILSATLIGCKVTNPQLYNTPVKLDPIKVDKGEDVKVIQDQRPADPVAEVYTQKVDLAKEADAKVDVLFLMDTSESMYCDQTKLTQNIKKFSDEFAKKKNMLDFRIGVVGAWDTETFGNKAKDCELGELRPVRSKESDNKSCSTNTAVNYVTRETPNLEAALGFTLAVGVEPLAKKNDAELFTSGPENEELFRPIIEALSADNVQKNHNFRRPDAHLAVVIFTDTDNYKTDDTTSDMIRVLRSSVTGDATVSAYAVMARYNDVVNFFTKGTPLRDYPQAGMRECSVNPVDPYIRTSVNGNVGGPKTMYQFLEQSKKAGMGGVGFDLKDADYGTKLADLAKGIVNKTSRKKIQLDFPINFLYPVKIKFGGKEIPKNDVTGWSYDPGQAGINDDKIVINEGANLQSDDPAAKLELVYTPARNR